jgi:hypothetical protein
MLGTGACTSSSDDTTSTTSPVETTTTTPPVPSATTTPAAATTLVTTTTIAAEPAGLRPRVVEPFAAFGDVPLVIETPSYQGPATPTSLDGVFWADQVPENARQLLGENGFVVVATPWGYGQFHEAYSLGAFYAEQPVFVTTDAAYHYWHLAFAKALRDTETDVLLPALEAFAARLRVTAEAQSSELAGTSLAEPAERVALYAQTLEALLATDPGPYSPEVDAELMLIVDHAGIAVSPTTGQAVDYSLFNPRGHYTRTDDLKRFFVAMSLLGLSPFKLGEADSLRTGLLLSRLFADEDIVELWRTVYEPTAFLVGLADDHTPLEAIAAAERVIPGWIADPAALGDDAAVAAVADDLLAARGVAIDSVQASVRVMGARFVLDSYILDQLVDPNVEGRLQGSPLDVAAAFGSDWAYARQEARGIPDDFSRYDSQLESMRTLVSSRDDVAWASTVYDAWLYALQPMWTEFGAAYPDFMRTAAWAAKAHQTGFGSYAELKHDTILYAKQAFAEGEAPLAPAEPRHWVEPDPVAFERLAAAARLMHDGLAIRDLLTDEVAGVLDEIVAMYERFARLARDELAGRPITPEDNEWLETIGSRFELIWLLAAQEEPNETGGFPESPDDVAALIADIMSNPGQALEIGTGMINDLFVLVPNDAGQFQVARGGVYSYYEFWVPRDERLTDEEWRKMVSDGKTPGRPSWQQVFLVEE